MIVPPTLLVVDDEENLLLLLDRVLSKDGFQIKTAANAYEALELVEHEQFSLAIIDIRMCPIDGVTLLEEIRKRSPETRVIMTTGYPSVDSREKCLELGASHYLIKPIEIPELKNVLRHLLER